jgi:hypothetical protein
MGTMFQYSLQHADERKDALTRQKLCYFLDSGTTDTTLTHIVATVPGEISEDVKKRIRREWKRPPATIDFNPLTDSTTIIVSKSALTNWILIVIDVCIAVMAAVVVIGTILRSLYTP